MAMTLEDVLARRTRIMLEDADRGAGVAPEVAVLMAHELDWSGDHTRAQVEKYRALVAHQYEVEDLRQ
jgi:glycerol-3-phosphate dehydrogenase